MNPISLRGAADVLAVLPYQLGYHPQDSLVLVALDEGTVGFVARIDLPPPEHAAQASRTLLAPLLRERPDAVVLVGYEDVRGRSTAVLDVLAIQLAGAGIDVLERLVVRDDRWFSLDCDEPCCPPDGVPVQRAVDTPAVAEFVGLGVAPLPGRRSLTEMVAADEAVAGPVAQALAAAARSRGGRVSSRPAGLALWAIVCDVGAEARAVEDLSAREVAEVVLALDDRELRDGVVAWIAPGSMPLDCLSPDLLDALRSALPEPSWEVRTPDGAGAIAGRRLLARLQTLARAVPDDACAPVLTVLANYAWWLGDGALARVALDRGLTHSPGYRLAVLLERMIDLGVRPGGGRGGGPGDGRGGGLGDGRGGGPGVGPGGGPGGGRRRPRGGRGRDGGGGAGGLGWAG